MLSLWTYGPKKLAAASDKFIFHMSMSPCLQRLEYEILTIDGSLSDPKNNTCSKFQLSEMQILVNRVKIASFQSIKSRQLSYSEPKVVTFKISSGLEVSILIIVRQNRITWKKFRRLVYQQQLFLRASNSKFLWFFGSLSIVLSRVVYCSRFKHWAAKWHIQKWYDWQINFECKTVAVTGTCRNLTYSNQRLTGSWSRKSKTVNHISDHFQMSLRTYHMSLLFLISDDKAECVAKFRFAFELMIT